MALKSPLPGTGAVFVFQDLGARNADECPDGEGLEMAVTDESANGLGADGPPLGELLWAKDLTSGVVYAVGLDGEYYAVH